MIFARDLSKYVKIFWKRYSTATKFGENFKLLLFIFCPSEVGRGARTVKCPLGDVRDMTMELWTVGSWECYLIQTIGIGYGALRGGEWDVCHLHTIKCSVPPPKNNHT